MILNISRKVFPLSSKPIISKPTNLFGNAHSPILPSVSVRTKVNKAKLDDWDFNETAKSARLQVGKGKIYDKKPFKFTVVKGKSYLWCSCGWSKSQPFCDSTHKNPHYKITMRPIRFIAPETKEYTFCNCKQTSNRPFCDGTHIRDDIQAAIKN